MYNIYIYNIIYILKNEDVHIYACTYKCVYMHTLKKP